MTIGRRRGRVPLCVGIHEEVGCLAQRYAKQRPKSVENCGADIELKARSQPMGTRLDARSSGGCGLGALLAGADALVS